ncbi:Protein HESO1 [Bienertia sinuspersici]
MEVGGFGRFHGVGEWLSASLERDWVGWLKKGGEASLSGGLVWWSKKGREGGGWLEKGGDGVGGWKGWSEGEGEGEEVVGGEGDWAARIKGILVSPRANPHQWRFYHFYNRKKTSIIISFPPSLVTRKLLGKHSFSKRYAPLKWFAMDMHTMLEVSLNEILHVVNPLREDLETRMRIVDELRDAVGAVESLRGATVEPFGSFVSQLYTRWGDLDISIELSNGSYISVAAKKLKQTLLGDVLKALRRTAGSPEDPFVYKLIYEGSFRRLQFVSHARVPILKLESKYQNISCDISINNLSGLMKSKSLLWISLIDRRFRDMVLLVKEWAKANNINNPKFGTFNSYSLSLLVIFHFQTCVPAILPPLKDLYPGNMADELIGSNFVLYFKFQCPDSYICQLNLRKFPEAFSFCYFIGIRADVERRIEETSFSNIAKFRKERKVNRSGLAELFTSFLAKFSDISTRAAEQGISTYTGQWEDIHTTTRWQPKTYAIFIEDPFEQPQNTARAVSSTQLKRIGSAFTNTHQRIVAPNQTRNTLIPCLVRPEISRFFPGVAFVNPMTNGGIYPMMNPNARHGTGNYAPWQFPNQFQKTRQPNRSPVNMVPQNAKQALQGQAIANNQQLPKNKPRSRTNRVAREAAVPSEGQAQILSLPLLPGQANNVASQRPVKPSQRQPQQIWRPKLSDN